MVGGRNPGISLTMYDMYQEMILLHYRSPHNFGKLASPSLSGEESNPLCGDHIRLELRLEGPESKVEEVKFSGDGCAISMASSSMLTDTLKGKSLAEVRRITQEDILKLVAIPLSPARIRCALTGFTALGRALLASDEGGSSEPPSTPAA
ncbi:MAG: iron-sulfur cluster assembly scaffold protein [Thermoplasmata archaeon]|nr:iron-sulfur cluster assembly scaffold protein [Thermoplasmata archaeon]